MWETAGARPQHDSSNSPSSGSPSSGLAAKAQEGCGSAGSKHGGVTGTQSRKVTQKKIERWGGLKERLREREGGKERERLTKRERD